MFNAHFKNRLARRRSRLGMTMVELVIALSISGLLMIIVAGLQLISGRAIKDLYNQTRTRSSQMRAIDQIRYRLADAKPIDMDLANGHLADGSTISIDIPTDTDLQEDPPGSGIFKKLPVEQKVDVMAYRTIEFQNPNVGDNKWSRFSFDATAHKLYYQADKDDGSPPISVVDGPIDVRFVPLESGAVVQLLVRSQAYIAAKVTGEVNGVATYTIVDEEDGLTTVYLRN